jgi:hypothetical protein
MTFVFKVFAHFDIQSRYVYIKAESFAQAIECARNRLGCKSVEPVACLGTHHPLIDITA